MELDEIKILLIDLLLPF